MPTQHTFPHDFLFDSFTLRMKRLSTVETSGTDIHRKKSHSRTLRSPWLTPFRKSTRVVPKVMSNFFFACELGTADEVECGGRWNQLLCYPWVSCDVNSLHHVTCITPNKMAENDMSFRQRAVIEFLVKEEIPAAEIHQRLHCAYGSVCMGASSASVSSDGWNGVLPQGNFQTSRMLGEMCTKKWRLCGKIKNIM